MGIRTLDSLLLYVKNVSVTASFYKKLGFTITKQGDHFAIAQIQSFEIHFHDETEQSARNEANLTPKGLGLYIYINVEKIDEYFSLLKKQGVQLQDTPTDYPWGNREFSTRDPDGYKLVFYEAKPT